MANAIIILILIALMCIAAVRIYRTIKYGGSCCSGGGAMDKKIRVKDRNSSNYPYCYTLKVDGMVCSGCVRKVENAINSDGQLSQQSFACQRNQAGSACVHICHDF